MKAKTLTVRQPYVAAIFARLKRHEFRTWSTRYRGPLLIHAAGAYDHDAIEDVLGSAKHRRALGITGSHNVTSAAAAMPMSAIIGQVELVDCMPAEDVPQRLRGWGDYSQECFAWRLADPRLFRRPLRMPGKLGLWEAEVPQGLVDLLVAV